MAEIQNFRSAFHGFKREDVVNYIEYMNNQHKAQLEQLNNQLATAQAQLAERAPADSELLAQLDAANARIAELEEILAQTPSTQPNDELEAYRRAERTERIARERAAQIYSQANAVLSDATLKVDAAASQVGAAVDGLAAHLQQYQTDINGTKALLQDAVAAMYAIRPEE